jgi:hypothetical protein
MAPPLGLFLILAYNISIFSGQKKDTPLFFVDHAGTGVIKIAKRKGERHMDEDIKKRTQETAKKLWTGGVKLDPPYLMWKEFDRDLANDLSLLSRATFIQGPY